LFHLNGKVSAIPVLSLKILEMGMEENACQARARSKTPVGELIWGK